MADMVETVNREAIEKQVLRLLELWRAETAYLSDSTRRNSHPAYQEIIALGTVALPALFRDLEQTLDGHLAKALTTITAAHPVPAEDRGKIQLVAEAWLRWARAWSDLVMSLELVFPGLRGVAYQVTSPKSLSHPLHA